MAIAHAAIAFWHHFHSWITKNIDLETVSHFGTQILDKSQKGLQNDSKRLPKWTLKSIKMDSLTPMCPLGVPLDPWITKVVPSDPKLKPQGLQNDSFNSKK